MNTNTEARCPRGCVEPPRRYSRYSVRGSSNPVVRYRCDGCARSFSVVPPDVADERVGRPKCPNGCAVVARSKGRFVRACDGIVRQRFQCPQCAHSWSAGAASDVPPRMRTKQQVYEEVLRGIKSGMSDRSLSRTRGVTRKTVAKIRRGVA